MKNINEVKSYTKVQTALGLGVFLSFMWLFINSIILVASIIILLNVDGYEERTFLVSGLNYHDDPEAGLSWSITGEVNGVPLRYADNVLLKNEKVTAGKLRRKFPKGSEIPVLYNPDVTDDLFQNRTVDVITYVPDLAKAEKERIIDAIQRYLLPFIGFSLILYIYSSSLPRL